MEDGQYRAYYISYASPVAGAPSTGLAVSDNGEIDGRFIQQEPLFTKDGGHGMLFRTAEGRLCLALHSPNKHLQERPRFIPVTL